MKQIAVIYFDCGAHAPAPSLSKVVLAGAPSFAAHKIAVTHETDIGRKGWDKLKFFAMPEGLRRRHGEDDLHYITCSCYQRRPFLESAHRRDVFLKIFEQVRQRYEFAVVGYVVMPEHFHILVGEPDDGNLSVAMQVLKQRVARLCLNRGRSNVLVVEKKAAPPFWYPRSYDFNVFTEKKIIEKLRYMHRNPVKRGLVEFPEQWRWSSYRYYLLGEEGPVKIKPK
jgi:putative transposase